MTKPADQLPHNIEAEQALLGAIFINNEAYWRVSPFLHADHFYEPMHAEIFSACATMIAGGSAATPVTVRGKLPERLTDEVTMSQYLARLCTEATTVLNASEYGMAIKDTAARRDLIEIAERMKADAISRQLDTTASDIVEQAEQSLYAIAKAGGNPSRITGFGDAVTEALDMAAAAYQRDGGLSGVATGLSDLDRLMGGLQRSDLIILAARPGIGKTSLATNIAFYVANSYVGQISLDGTHQPVRGGRVLFYSLEMSAEQLATRILSEQAGIPSSIIRRGAIHEAQFGNLTDVANRIRTIPLTIEDTGSLNIGQLAASARRQKRQKGLDLVIVDYIQLLSGTTRRSGENRVQEVTEITTKLKALAKELEVPIVALSQLSRQVESRDDKRPQLADLRESGSIEQDADVVLFIYREEYYLAHREPKEGTPKHVEWEADMEAAHGKADVIIAKQRHGPTGTVPVRFEAHLTRFSDLPKGSYLPDRLSADLIGGMA